MRTIFFSLLTLITTISSATAQDAAPGSAMVDLHVPSIAQPMLPAWYSVIYLAVALVAVFFILVLYRTIKDKTYLQ